MTTSSMASPLLVKGDPVECKEHGAQSIAEGDEAGMVNGSPVALHGHRAVDARWLAKGQQSR